MRTIYSSIKSIILLNCKLTIIITKYVVFDIIIAHNTDKDFLLLLHGKIDFLKRILLYIEFLMFYSSFFHVGLFVKKLFLFFHVLLNSWNGLIFFTSSTTYIPIQKPNPTVFQLCSIATKLENTKMHNYLEQENL